MNDQGTGTTLPIDFTSIPHCKTLEISLDLYTDLKRYCYGLDKNLRKVAEMAIHQYLQKRFYVFTVVAEEPIEAERLTWEEFLASKQLNEEAEYSYQRSLESARRRLAPKSDDELPF